jgi:hypothetical protein
MHLFTHLRRFLLLFLITLLVIPTTEAATFTVSNLNNSGGGSFRQALLNANGSPGADIIEFTVSGTISVIGALPTITGPVTIDGTTAPGYIACSSPRIALDGGGGSANGLQLVAGASGSTITALNVRNFQFNAIQLIGTDNCTITRNYIGTNIFGTAAIPNGQNGIQMEGGADNNLIGGSGICDGNVISGNTGIAISNILGLNDTIRGNLIGLTANGLSALGNAGNGMYSFGATGMVVGGTGPNDGNVIAGSGFHGLILDGGSNNTVVQGNRIGTNANGTAPLGNADSGILVINTDDLIIGGNTPGARNILSGSQTEFGVFLINTNNSTVQGNYIGTDITGTIAMPNDGGGIQLEGNCLGNRIGGSGAGEGNIIAHSPGFGVSLPQASVSQTLISRNSIYCNTGPGIDLGGLGNTNKAAPIIATASISGCSGTAQPNDIIELFYDSTCTATCQGKDYIATVTADGLGNWSYVGALAPNVRLAATATDASNNTSEFACFSLLPVEGLVFDAEITGPAQVQLDWSTNFEASNMRFDVERSTDGQTFLKIGDLPGAGNDPDGESYQFEDRNVQGDLLYYRLKQVDFNGDFEYSDVVTVQFSATTPEIVLFPQPANQELHLRFQHSGESVPQYQILDFQGRTLLEDELLVQHNADYRISLDGLADGLYFLTIRTNAGSSVKRFQVQR